MASLDIKWKISDVCYHLKQLVYTRVEPVLITRTGGTFQCFHRAVKLIFPSSPLYFSNS